MTDTMQSSAKGRHTTWFSTAASSVIALVAIVNFLDTADLKVTDTDKHTKWAVSGLSLVLSFSALSVFAHFLMKDKFVGQPLEGLMALVTCGFAAATMPAIMDPDNLLALNERSNIMNSNLYFASWGSLIMSYMILMDWTQEFLKSASTFFPRTWFSLCITSFITMMAASRLYDITQCGDPEVEDSDYCKKVQYGISIGVISGVMSLAWMVAGYFMTGFLAKLIDFAVTSLLIVFWCAGIAYLTFTGHLNPADEVGNFYFFTWGSFGLSVSLFMTSVQRLHQAFMEDNDVAESDTPVEDKPAEDMPAEDKPEDKKEMGMESGDDNMGGQEDVA